MSFEKGIFLGLENFRTKLFFFTMVKKSENGKNHEKIRLWNLFQNRNKKNVENSEIGPDSETLTSDGRELVDSNSNQLSFIQALGVEALVRSVRNKVPYENGGKGGRGGESPIIEIIVTNFFVFRFWGKFHSRLFQNSKKFLNI